MLLLEAWLSFQKRMMRMTTKKHYRELKGQRNTLVEELEARLVFCYVERPVDVVLFVLQINPS